MKYLLLLTIGLTQSCSIFTSKAEDRNEKRQRMVNEYINEQKCLRDKRYCKKGSDGTVEQDWMWLPIPKKISRPTD
jgi:hypothetical protein